MLRRFLRRFRWPLLLCLTPALLLVAYYSYYQQRANHWMHARGIHYEHANAAKHTLAAAELYQRLRQLTLSPERSESLVLSLGYASERLENFVRPHRTRDSNAETLKDLYNNQVGILTAVTLEGTPVHLEDIALSLAKHGPTIGTEAQAKKQFTSSALVEAAPTPRHCIQWFEENRQRLRQEIAAQLPSPAGAAGGN